MKYEELLKQKNSLTAQLCQVEKEIAEYQNKEFLNNLDVAITALKNTYEIEPYATIEVECECDCCDRVMEVDINLEDIIQELMDMKERYSK